MTTLTRNPTGLDASSGTWDSTDYTVINDYPDTVDYLTHGTTAGNATWTVTAPDVPTGATNISVAIKWYSKKTASPGCTMAGRIKIGASYYGGTQQAQTTSAALYTTTWATNPATAGIPIASSMGKVIRVPPPASAFTAPAAAAANATRKKSSPLIIVRYLQKSCHAQRNWRDA